MCTRKKLHKIKNSTTGADASGGCQLAGIHKSLTTHSELANTEAKQMLINHIGNNQLGVTATYQHASEIAVDLAIAF